MLSNCFAPARRSALAGFSFAMAAFAITGVVAGGTAAAADDDAWASIRKELFAERAISEANGQFQLFAPSQAADAAVVPISIRFPQATASRIRSLTLVIDRNPAPVVATFAFGDGYRQAADIGERAFETRIRLDSFSKLRAVAEFDDGSLAMISKFISGAGGCSAPASKDASQALAELGKMRISVRKDEVRSALWRQAQVMIRHPNYTGMQMNSSSGAYTPARFVDQMEVRLGGKTVFRMTGGISISENPHITFTYGAASDQVIDVVASDTNGTSFSGSSAGSGS